VVCGIDQSEIDGLNAGEGSRLEIGGKDEGVVGGRTASARRSAIAVVEGTKKRQVSAAEAARAARSMGAEQIFIRSSGVGWSMGAGDPALGLAGGGSGCSPGRCVPALPF